MSKDIKRAYEIYSKNHFTLNILSDDLLKEFNEYEIEQSQIDLWNDEYCNNLLDEIYPYLDNIDKNGIKKGDILHQPIGILSRFSFKHDNSKKILLLFEKMKSCNVWLSMFDPYERPSAYFKALLFEDTVMVDSFRRLGKHHYNTGQRFNGFLPYLFYNNEIELYNELFELMCEVIREKGIYFQSFIKSLLCFTEEYNDMENHQKVISSLEYSKKHCTIRDDFFKEWEI